MTLIDFVTGKKIVHDPTTHERILTPQEDTDTCDGCHQWFDKRELIRFGGENLYCSRECWEADVSLDELS